MEAGGLPLRAGKGEGFRSSEMEPLLCQWKIGELPRDAQVLQQRINRNLPNPCATTLSLGGKLPEPELR